jgi:hypothetical protein
MRFHQVEVDDMVFQFVKHHAEPLVDTFNSTLRRLLLSDNQKQTAQLPDSGTIQSHPASSLPSLPQHFPQALQQILEVIHLVRSGSYTRPGATQYVARQLNVFPQTVLDKYCRQLGLTANQFDRFMEEPGLGELRKKLKSRFSDYAKEIDEALQ